MSATIKIFAAVFALTLGSAHGTLIDRGGGLIYDSTLNVTWLQDANYANSVGFSATTNGAMTWSDATSWAAALHYFDPVRNQVVTGWRLPTVHPADNSLSDGCAGFDGGYNVITGNSEMASLFYKSLGNRAILTPECSVDPEWNASANLGPFLNLQSGSESWSTYWSGTTQAVYQMGAWDFNFSTGRQNNGSSKQVLSYALLVHDGDLAPNPVSEPATILLFGLGFAWLSLGTLSRSRNGGARD